MRDEQLGSKRKLKQAVYELFKAPSTEARSADDGANVKSWKELTEYAVGTDYWKARVICMRQPAVNMKLRNHVVEGCVCVCV